VSKLNDADSPTAPVNDSGLSMVLLCLVFSGAHQEVFNRVFLAARHGSGVAALGQTVHSARETIMEEAMAMLHHPSLKQAQHKAQSIKG
jgi:hypothetical protein